MLRADDRSEHACDRGHNGQRLLGELAPSDANYGVAGGNVRLVAAAIALKGRSVAVELVAVELDNQLLVRPEEVSFEPGDPHVRKRLRKTGVAQQLQHPALAFPPR